MAKKNDDLPNLTLTGDITINGPMFDIHDNEKVEIWVKGQRKHEQEEYDFINLEFFDPDIFNTSERQNGYGVRNGQHCYLYRVHLLYKKGTEHQEVQVSFHRYRRIAPRLITQGD